ncbi:MAG TPA: alkane 1-monooxygenase [Deltaproteobacteria bacterium]|nr:alkane 1-monooxygenase [Deltaproteobacteria bacterium]
MSVLPYYLIFVVPFSVVLGYSLGGALTFLTPVLVFGVVPLLDIAIGVSRKNPAPEEEGKLSSALRFRLVTWLCVPLQIALVLWGAFVVTYEVLWPIEFAGFITSMGISSGIMGINVSHELQHRVNNSFEPFLSRLMLWTVGYMHWAIEHVAGHHRHVATPRDPATARLGDSFYAFWPRTVFGGFRSAWRIEAERLGKKGLPVWSLHNRMIRYGSAEIALVLALRISLGTEAAVYLVVQGLIAFTLLEIVNYIEHYGLIRRETSPGTFEPVSPVHSWNAGNYLTNRFLFNLQRHSDHHSYPGRRYQVLRHFDESPQLPTGYAGMVLIAVIPPLWRSIMDRRLSSFRS